MFVIKNYDVPFSASLLSRGIFYLGNKDRKYTLKKEAYYCSSILVAAWFSKTCIKPKLFSSLISIRGIVKI